MAAVTDPGRLRVLRPALRAGRPGINMATRKKHTPEQVVRKLATADREPRRDKYTTWTAGAPDLVFTVLTYGTRAIRRRRARAPTAAGGWPHWQQPR